MKNEINHGYTERQGQYLSFIYYYMKINKMAPSESDIARYFEVASSTAHSMLRELRVKQLIKSEPGKPRSIELLISREKLPELD